MENPERREDPATLLPGAISVVAAGLGCYRAVPPPRPGEGRVARYATGPDYHELMGEKLGELLAEIRKETACTGTIAVDSSAAMDRALARRAGLGWPGKSSCLISSRHGPWMLLGELVVDTELLPDAPVVPRCGRCTRCVEACPTGAIVSPGVVDAARCVAYLTVEARGAVPLPLRHLVGDRLFGCDACLESCPWSRFAEETRAFPARLPAALPAAGFLELDEESFRRRFSGTVLARTGRARMARNAAVVLGNLRFTQAGAALAKAMEDPEPLVRSHAAWALGRCGRQAVLRNRLSREEEPAVRSEIGAALGEGRA